MKKIIGGFRGWLKGSPSLDMTTYLIALVGLALLPIFATPWVPVSVDKQFWLLILSLILVVFWLVGRVQKGLIIIPRSKTLFFGLLLVLVFFISALFSENQFHSLVGSGFDLGSVMSIAVLFLLFLLYSFIFDRREKVLNAYILLFGSSIFLGVYLMVNVLIRFYNLPFFQGLPLNIFGNWYSLGIFFGFISLSALIILELFPSQGNRWFSYLLSSVFAFSLFILALVNYYPVWFIFGLSSLLVFVYVLTFGVNTIRDKDASGKVAKEEVSRRVWRPSFIALLISLCFVILGGQGGVVSDSVDRLYERINFVFVDDRPIWSDTVGVVSGTWRSNPVLGVGPNNFSHAWALFKPESSNLQPYWNLNFSVGTGLIPTFFSTVGILGTIAILIFVSSILFYGLRGIFNEKQDAISRLTLFLLFAGSLYLWIFSFLFAVPATLLGLTFMVSGLLIAQLASVGIINYGKIYLTDTSRSNFFAVLVIVVMVLFGVAGVYFGVQKYWAANVFYKAFAASNERSLDETTVDILRAIRFDSRNELYYQALILINQARMIEIAQATNLSPEEVQARGQMIIGLSDSAFFEATRLNSLNHQNYVLRADFMWLLMNLGVSGAGEQVNDSLVRAINLNPKNPSLYVALTRTAFNMGDTRGAREAIEEALRLKNNYIQAMFILAQLDLEEGLADSALSRAEQALLMNPNDPAGYFQIGYLYYRLGDFEEAVEALERSVASSPGGVNANSQYFLGLSYDGLGRRQQALDQFEAILQFNPGNSQLVEIVNNLRAGRPALSGNEVSPIEEIEIEIELPIEEE